MNNWSVQDQISLGISLKAQNHYLESFALALGKILPLESLDSQRKRDDSADTSSAVLVSPEAPDRSIAGAGGNPAESAILSSSTEGRAEACAGWAQRVGSDGAKADVSCSGVHQKDRDGEALSENQASPTQSFSDAMAERIEANPSARQRPSKSHEEGSTPSGITNLTSGSQELGQREDAEPLKANEETDAGVVGPSPHAEGHFPSAGQFISEEWRNGRRTGLKISTTEGSTPSSSIISLLEPPITRRELNAGLDRLWVDVRTSGVLTDAINPVKSEDDLGTVRAPHMQQEVVAMPTEKADLSSDSVLEDK